MSANHRDCRYAIRGDRVPVSLVCSCIARRCVAGLLYTWFPALRCGFRIRFRNRFRKSRVRTCRSVNTVAVCRYRSVLRGSGASDPVGRPAIFPRNRVGGAPGVLAAETEK